MFSLQVDRICGYVVEVCKALAELVILAAFGVALIIWLGTWADIIKWG